MTLRARIIRIGIAAYCILSLPFVLVLLKSDYVQYVTIQMATNWKGKLVGVTSVYVGDSITAGGRNWGAPLDAINLAGNGYTVWQIKNQLEKAEIYSPKRLFILAGTNDILGDRPFDERQFELDFARLLDRAQKMKATIIVTLIPFTSKAKPNQSIFLANQMIRALADSREILTIDLNPAIAPHGILLPEYTVDGVHFTPDAYKLWRAKLQVAIAKHDAKP